MNRLLLIFTKNPERGKVKTRLAKTIGDEKALDIYKRLIQHTAEVTLKANSDKKVCYATYLEANDSWSKDVFQKTVQLGNDLGERMLNAFQEAFQSGYKKVVIIGTDCLDISTEIINNAFDALNKHDLVIGPSEDGGYYLLGMSTLQKQLFLDKAWSTASVFEETIQNIKAKQLSYFQLPTLNDIDTEEDWDKALNK